MYNNNNYNLINLHVTFKLIKFKLIINLKKTFTKLILKIKQKIFSIIYPIIDKFSSKENNSLRSFITYQTYGNILEIGAGAGANYNYYKNYNNLILVDNNIDLLKQNKIDKQCLLILANSEYLPFKKSEFDSIVTSLVLCSVNDVEKTLSEIDRVLKPTGKYFFWEHTVMKNNLLYIIKKLFIFIWRFLTGNCNYNIDNLYHIHKIKWGKLEIHNQHSKLVKFFGLYYIYGKINKNNY